MAASSDARDERAHRLMERIGMRREAYHREMYPGADGWIDVVTYAMLEGEWRERHPDLAALLGVEGRAERA